MKEMMKKFPFKIRLFMGICIILTALALLVSFLFSYASLKNAVHSEGLSSQGMLEQIKAQVDALYLQMDTAALSITKNPILKNIVLELNSSEQNTSEEYLEKRRQERTIQTSLGNVLFSPVISNAILYNRDLRYFYYAGTYLNDWDYIDHALDNRDITPLLQNRSVIYKGPEPHPWQASGQDVVSVIRNFSGNQTSMGTVVEILAPYDELDSICAPKSFRNDREILILDENGQMIYPRRAASTILSDGQYGQIKEALASGISSGYRYAYSWHSGRNDITGHTMLLVSNNRNIRTQAGTYIAFTLAVVFATLFVTMGVMFGILSMFTKPLKQLISSVGNLRFDSDAGITLPDDALDEFEILSTTLDQMVENLKDSIQKNYELKLRESKSSLAALQAQVDPHFLYNAMNSISAASELYGSEMTTAMCQKFSSIMRYVTSPRTFVPLIEEIKHTENYMEFMKISNDGNFTYSIEIDPTLYTLSIPKLSIQPFVENSFKHGFKSTMPPWSISINGYVTTEGGWRLEIRDNGCGFDRQVIRDISLMPLAYHELEVDGLGLNNTFSRFYLHFKGQFTYEIRNLEQGCSIQLEGVFLDDETDCS